jgi:hypothetical protein
MLAKRRGKLDFDIIRLSLGVKDSSETQIWQYSRKKMAKADNSTKDIHQLGSGYHLSYFPLLRSLQL